MTSQKTIERCRARVKELEDANKTLLDNNVILSRENTQLRNELKMQRRVNAEIEEKRTECAQKCRVALSEKDEALQRAQRAAANTKTLKDIKWSLDNEHGKIILTGVLPPC